MSSPCWLPATCCASASRGTAWCERPSVTCMSTCSRSGIKRLRTPCCSATICDRALYEDTKRELTSRQWPDMNAYADAKTDVIEAIKARAREQVR